MAHDDYQRGLGVLLRGRTPATPSRTVIGQAGRTVPSLPTKGIFERGPQFYSRVAGGSIGFATSLRCDSIILHKQWYSAEKLERALAAGLKVWVWSGPDSFYPSNFEATIEALRAICNSDHRINGYIANVERVVAPSGHDPQDDWGSATPAHVARLGAMLHEDSLRFSVGLSSIPAWPHMRTIARMAPHVWGSPQLYGVISPAPPAVLLQRGRPWERAFGQGYVPELAAWSRTAPEQRAYLEGMSSISHCIFWHAELPTNDTFAAIRDFQPRGTRSGGGGVGGGVGGVLAALGLGVLGGLITWAITPK